MHVHTLLIIKMAGRRRHDRIIVGFTINDAVSAYHH